MADGGYVPESRQDQFAYFQTLSNPYVGVTVQVDVTELAVWCRERGTRLLSGGAVRCGPSGQRRAGAAAAHPGRSGGGVRPLPLLPYGGSTGRDLLLLQPGGGPALPGVPALRGGGAGAGEGAHPGGRRGRGEPVLCLPVSRGCPTRP